MGFAFQMKWAVQDVLRKRGKEITRLPLLQFLRGYGSELRRLGYRDRIVSFEPLPNLFQELEVCAASAAPWTAVPVAIGREQGAGTFHVSSNFDGSSFPTMLEKHRLSAPGVVPGGSISVPVERLETFQLLQVDGIFFRAATFNGLSPDPGRPAATA